MVSFSEYEKAKKRFDKAKLAMQEAKKLIDAYEEEEYRKKLERLKNLKRNDYVEYIGGRKTKNLTIGKEYRLTGDSFRNMIAIENDAGKRIVIQPIKHFKF